MKRIVIDAEAWLARCADSYMHKNLARKIIRESPTFAVDEAHLTPVEGEGQAAPAPQRAERPCRCRACGAEIKWILLTSGKKMPCDAGVVLFRADASAAESFVTASGHVVRGLPVADEETGSVGYVSHFTTCPQADTFRRGEK